ncbi:MAG: peptidoglycan D,D-transpeptidase FtsI family protein [Acutalibacteraceae bacterium]
MKSRAVTLYISICLCFLALMIKIVQINNRLYDVSSKSQQTKTITIGSSRGKIYDRNLEKLVDSNSRLIAAVTPALSVTQIKPLADACENLTEKIESGKPFTAEVKEEINNELVRTFAVPERYSDDCACHLVGYVDSSGQNGLSGIEKAYNPLLSAESGSLSVSFSVDANGKVLAGLDKTVNDNNFNSKAGVVLTIDKTVQQIAENALKNSKIKSGCALVMHVDTGEIYAMASVPTFDRNAVYKSLRQENSPLINKALQSYSVGSVFKPIIAACALESSVKTDFEYECTGKITVGDTVFNCYDSKAHGKQNMTKALENSCNTYFINLIKNIDSDYLLSVCRSLGFGSETELADALCSAAGVLPENSELLSPGEKANFSFGQGKLLVTPVQLLCAYHALATGNYVEPTVIRGTANKNGLVKTTAQSTPQKIFSDKTVLEIRKMLKSVVENGNASKAKSPVLELAGKTGTAQSGTTKNGKEICRTWFAGFFPADNPHYIVVVLNEDGISGSSDCAPVFKEICEKIALSQ